MEVDEEISRRLLRFSREACIYTHQVAKQNLDDCSSVFDGYFINLGIVEQDRFVNGIFDKTRSPKRAVSRYDNPVLFTEFNHWFLVKIDMGFHLMQKVRLASVYG
jgi:hypothetical protein